MNPVAVSFLSVAGGRERHHLVTFEDGVFRMQEPETGMTWVPRASHLVRRLLEPLHGPGPAHLVIIDHGQQSFAIGFVARRESTEWSEVTCPDEQVPISWQDVDAECWAALTRLLEARLEALPEGPTSTGVEEHAEVES